MESLISALIAAILTSYLTGRIVWKWQREQETKYKVYELVVETLAEMFADAYDGKLQIAERTVGGLRASLALRPTTQQKVLRCQGMVKAYFSANAHQKVRDAMFCKLLPIDPEQKIVPDNAEFTEKAEIAKDALASELKIGTFLNFKDWKKL